MTLRLMQGTSVSKKWKFPALARRQIQRPMSNLRSAVALIALMAGMFWWGSVAEQNPPDPPSRVPLSSRNIHQAHWSFQCRQRAYPLDVIPGGARARVLREIQAKSPIARWTVRRLRHPVGQHRTRADC